jgi:predicted  nucleic acid-binding Zn-ribbon protein
MGGVNVPYLPTSLWLLSGALTILLLFVVFGYYVYLRKRATALLEDVDSVAALAAKRQFLQVDIEAMRQWMNDQKAELDRLQAEREEQERLRALLADLEQQCATKEQGNQALRNEVGELENQRYNLSQTLEKLEREIGDLDAKRAEAQAIDGRLAELRSKRDEAQEAVRGLAEVQSRLEALSTEKTALERVVTALRADAGSAQAEVEQHTLQAEKARTDAEEVKSELAERRREWAQLDVLMDTLRGERRALESDIERLEKYAHDLKTSAQVAEENIRKHRGAVAQARAEAEKASRELVEVQRDRQRLEVELGELNTRKVVLEKELTALDGRLGTRPGKAEDSLASYADLLSKPACLDKDEFVEKRAVQDEIDALDQFKNDLRKEGLVFSSRVINAFHTSLKCHDINPLTVLAGVSGTGKTLLPMRYAERMGMHRLVIAVQPRWDSPQDMFGFYNYLEKEYKATELARALIRMDPYNYTSEEFSRLDSAWTRDRLLLVLLDEMNLARTEYYFSEFLSKLELRREVKEPTDPAKRSQAEVELDAGPGEYRFRLWVGYNVFFVGTLNEDETTQTLSDKVLDRANVIRFGKPDEKARAGRIDTPESKSSRTYLSFDQWQSWQRKVPENEEWYEEVVALTRQLNEALDRVGRPFGFRVQQAIERYVANYPRAEEEERYKLAFADQVEQKIIPKLRGIDLVNTNANDCLDALEDIIAGLNDEELSRAFEIARTESQNLGMFQWRGVTRRDEDNV